MKAIEYYITSCLDEIQLDGELKPFVHFGITSEDINSMAYINLLRDSIQDVYIPTLTSVINIIDNFSETHRDLIMLSKTHGQNATPTTFGYQMKVFTERLVIQKKTLRKKNYRAKFGGATGGLNAHYLIYPDIEWDKLLTNWLLVKYKIHRNIFTTQVDHNDIYSEIFDIIKRINTILLDLVKDIWLYISNGYIKQLSKDLEVGSSTMPHKVNPINFENAEGNLKLSSNLCNFLSDNLPQSRLQRDLSNSTIFRNIFQPIGYSIIAMNSINQGFSKIEPNHTIIKSELFKSWEIISEPIVYQLKVWGIPDAYNKLKSITRNKNIDREALFNWIDSQEYLNTDQKNKLKTFSPQSYIPFKCV